MSNAKDNVGKIIDILTKRTADWIDDAHFEKVDWRRLFPYVAIILLMSVTISHEAKYAGSFEPPDLEYVGWPYAIAINLSIIISEFFVRWKTTRKWAWISFCVFTIMSGGMNSAWVRPWDLGGIDAFFAWSYALFPTLGIVSLGFLASSTAKLSDATEKRWENEYKKAKAKEKELKAKLKLKLNANAKAKPNVSAKAVVKDESETEKSKGERARKKKLNKVKVKQKYRKSPNAARKQIAKEIGISPQYVSTLLAELEAEGKIKIDGRTVNVL